MEQLNNLLSWLKAHNAKGFEESNVCFQYTQLSGLGCIAKHSYKIDDIIFTIPRSIIIGYNAASSSPLCIFLTSLSDLDPSTKSNLTCELIIFIEMIYNLKQIDSYYHSYTTTLDYKILPSILSWPPDLQQCLLGTNLGHSLSNASKNIKDKLVYIRHLISLYKPDVHGSAANTVQNNSYIELLYGIDEYMLTWAWSHYLSRRYPGHFAPASGGSGESLQSPLHTREADFGNLGSLVPLLDILNHNSDHEYLRFEVTEESLLVICNHSVAQVRYISILYLFIKSYYITPLYACIGSGVVF